MKHGKWIEKVDDTLHGPYEKIVCSVCGNDAFYDESYGYNGDTNYCHHCGAKMDGEENNKAWIDCGWHRSYADGFAHIYKCPVCTHMQAGTSNYCPICGEKLGDETKEPPALKRLIKEGFIIKH